MKLVPENLAALQRWFQRVISDPAGIEAGRQSAEAQRAVSANELESVVLPSAHLSASDRLAVYSTAYFARLLGCLRELFPALHFTLGETFEAFALGYLQQHPSTSYSLGHLAVHFVEYLEANRPESEDTSENEWADFVVDLARLEWTIEEIFDGPGEEEEASPIAEQIAALAPEAWPQARLRVSRSLRLLELRYPLNDYYAAARAGHEMELPSAGPSYLLLWRRNFVVRRWMVSVEAFKILRELSSGKTLAIALERGAEKCDNPAAFAAQIPAWFRDWGAAGIIVEVRSE